MDIREQLVAVFEDTRQQIRRNPVLQKAAAFSVKHTELYPAGKNPEMPELPEQQTSFHVSAEKTFQAAKRLHELYPDCRIAVHNFASATNPGGGVTRGSMAQEESLCRCSTLYNCLTRNDLWESYYQFHQNRHDVRYTDACIYSPEVMVFKNDNTLPELLPEQEWFSVDVLTCAAPNLRAKPYNAMNPGKGTPVSLTAGQLAALHQSRAEHMFRIALAHGVQILVLGAFGCGAFRNDPSVVAETYRNVFAKPEFHNKFRHVEFAVFHTEREQKNFTAFQSTIFR